MRLSPGGLEHLCLLVESTSGSDTCLALRLRPPPTVLLTGSLMVAAMFVQRNPNPLDYLRLDQVEQLARTN